MDYHHHYYYAQQWAPSPPPTDGPNTRHRLNYGLPPHSGTTMPLPPASYPSPAWSPEGEQWEQQQGFEGEWNAWPGEGGWEQEQERAPAPEFREREQEQPYSITTSHFPLPASAVSSHFEFELDPSLPLPTPQELERAYASYPHPDHYPHHPPPPSPFDPRWETTAQEASQTPMELELSGVAVSGLVSREEWLRLGGFGEEGPSAERERQAERRVDHRRVVSSSTNSITFDFDSPAPALPPPKPSEQFAFPSPSLPPPLPQPRSRSRPRTSSSSTRPPLSSVASFALPRPPPSSSSLVAPPPSPAAPSFALTALPILPAILEPKSAAAGGRKHHTRRTSVGHIPRPRNAFILFRQHAVSTSLVTRESLSTLPLPSSSSKSALPAEGEGKHKQKPLSQINVSQAVGAIWRAMPLEEKQGWERLAEEEKRLHAERWPGYKFAPRKKGEGEVKRRVGRGGGEGKKEGEGGGAKRRGRSRKDEEQEEPTPHDQVHAPLAPLVPSPLPPPSPPSPPPARSTFTLPRAQPPPPPPRPSLISHLHTPRNARDEGGAAAGGGRKRPALSPADSEDDPEPRVSEKGRREFPSVFAPQPSQQPSGRSPFDLAGGPQLSTLYSSSAELEERRESSFSSSSAAYDPSLSSSVAHHSHHQQAPYDNHHTSIDPSLLSAPSPLPPTPAPGFSSHSPFALAQATKGAFEQPMHEYHFGGQDLFAAPETSLESLFGGRVAR